MPRWERNNENAEQSIARRRFGIHQKPLPDGEDAMNTENLLRTVKRGIAGWREDASPSAGQPAGLGLSSADTEDNGSKLSWGGWLAIAAMVGLLVVSAVYALNIWNSVDAAMTGW